MRYFLDRSGQAAYFLDENRLLRSFRIDRAPNHYSLSSYFKLVNSAEMAAIVLVCQEVTATQFLAWMDSYWNIQCSFFNPHQLSIK